MKITAVCVFIGLVMANLICLLFIPEMTLAKAIERSIFQGFALVAMCISMPKDYK